MDESFRKLKQAFKAYPWFQEGGPPFRLTTDFSGTALSAVLSQEQDGVERFIRATGRKTTSGERNYPSHKGELAAAIAGIRRYVRTHPEVCALRTKHRLLIPEAFEDPEESQGAIGPLVRRTPAVLIQSDPQAGKK